MYFEICAAKEYAIRKDICDSMNLYDINIDDVNLFINIIKKQNFALATAVVSVLISGTWNETGSWNCPDTASCIHNWKYARKILNRRKLTKKDFYQYA